MKKKSIVNYFGMLLLLGGMGTSHVASAQSVLYQSIHDLETTGIPKTDNIQINAMKRHATTLGIEGGMYEATALIKKHLEEKGSQLDAIFDFSILMLEKDGYLILPAKIFETDSRVKTDSTVIRASRASLKIVSQPVFVTAVPTWRDYFTYEVSIPKITPNTITPTSDKEREIWQKYVRQGWKEGEEKAYFVYEQRMKKLVRDYQGYLRYHMARERNMVSEPKIIRNDYSLTGNKNAIRLDETVLVIGGSSQFNTNRFDWVGIPQLPDLDDLLPETLTPNVEE